MLNQLIKTGNAITFNIPKPPRPMSLVQNYALAQFSLYIEEVTLLKFKTKNRVLLHWLPYIPQFITEIQGGVLPLMTGPMSGCPLVSYSQNNNCYFSHVGTETGATAVNQAIRAACSTKLQDPSVHFNAGFDPYNEWTEFPKASTPGLRTACYAVLKPPDKMFAFWVEPIPLKPTFPPPQLTEGVVIAAPIATSFKVVAVKHSTALSKGEFLRLLAKKGQ